MFTHFCSNASKQHGGATPWPQGPPGCWPNGARRLTGQCLQKWHEGATPGPKGPHSDGFMTLAGCGACCGALCSSQVTSSLVAWKTLPSSMAVQLPGRRVTLLLASRASQVDGPSQVVGHAAMPHDPHRWLLHGFLENAYKAVWGCHSLAAAGPLCCGLHEPHRWSP